MISLGCVAPSWKNEYVRVVVDRVLRSIWKQWMEESIRRNKSEGQQEEHMIEEVLMGAEGVDLWSR